MREKRDFDAFFEEVTGISLGKTNTSMRDGIAKLVGKEHYDTKKQEYDTSHKEKLKQNEEERNAREQKRDEDELKNDMHRYDDKVYN